MLNFHRVVAALLAFIALAGWPHRAHATTRLSATGYTGSETVAYSELPDIQLPNSAVGAVGAHEAVVHFAVRDATHFKVVVRTLLPALQSGTLTVVADGTRVLSYDDRTGIALSAPIPRQHPRGLLNDLLGGLLSGDASPGALAPQPNPNGNVTTYLAKLRRPSPTLTPGVKFHASIVGQGSIAGRPVTIIDFGPTVTRSIGQSCSGSTCRPTKFRGSGSERLFVDTSHPFLLGIEGKGHTGIHDIGYTATTVRYRVTQIAYGVGPTLADLRFQPPVKVISGTDIFGFVPRGSDSGPGPGVSPPGPFVYPAAPNTEGIGTDEGLQRFGFGPKYRITQVLALFGTGSHATAYFYPPRHLGPFQYVTGPYLFVQEQLRVDGLPPALEGTPVMASACSVATGTYADGQRWLAFTHRNAAIVLSTNALTTQELVDYVAGLTVCAGA